MTRIVQLANFYGPQSGGLRTVVDRVGQGYIAAGIDRVLIVPGATDSEVVDEQGTRLTVAAPLLPGSGGYRVMIRRDRVAGLLDDLRPDCVEVSDKLSLGWVAGHGGVSVLFSHERIDAIAAPRVPAWFPIGAVADFRNRRLAARFDHVVCTSGFAQDEFDRVGATNVTRVPLGVDLDVFRPAPHRAGAALVCLGRLSKEKRPEVAIRALAALRDRGVDAHLIMVGGGPMRNALRAAAAGLPVTFTGHVSDRAAVARLLARADATIAPCPAETFGLSVLESLACGTPVVVSAAGGAHELITAGCGRAAPPDGESFAAAIETLLCLPRARLAARSRAEAYPWTRTVAGMLAVHGLDAVTQ